VWRNVCQPMCLRTGRGTLLFDRTDVERCREFQGTLKTRFAMELNVLGVVPQ
jgi:hypothetical protein